MKNDNRQEEGKRKEKKKMERNRYRKIQKGREIGVCIAEQKSWIGKTHRTRTEKTMMSKYKGTI